MSGQGSAGAIVIEPFSEARRRAAIELVDRIFPAQDPTERLSLRVFQTRWEWLLRLDGTRYGRFWLAVAEERVVGMVGLYAQVADRHEANWLGWFCVAPERRGCGLGRRLMDLALAEARASGRRFLRLYTSTDPNEAAAQGLYEAYGLRVVRMRRPLLWRLVGSRAALLYRERDLAAS
ncbi:MAG: GNAT family N-acetyltransferase [Hyphomicrobiales bacterium]|nr:GNAT family N-acetyltransferase [Hyphomicrobiales bacterium]